MNNIRHFNPFRSLYILLFFAYLFGPVIVMVVTAFNSSSFPRITPWDCLTADWFHKLVSDDKLLSGLSNSLIIGAGVVIIAVPIGLAAAMVLSQVGQRLRSVIYAIFIAPILMPGVVIGLSTLIFWDRLGSSINAAYDSIFYDGMFLTIIGQVTFISAYSMLVFLSRLQRFDATLTEAALDLGATQTQAFYKVLLPFMMPAIFSSAVLAFLASMENYNTTVFTIVADSTFTTVLAQKVRYGLDPSISAVAVIIVGITLACAVIFEAYTRHQQRQTAEQRLGHKLPPQRTFTKIASHPGTVAGLVFAVIIGGFVWVQNFDSSTCEARILEEKKAYQQMLMDQRKQNTPEPSATPAPTAPSTKAPSNSVFAPGNLTGASETEEPAKETKEAPASPFGGVFAPDNLAPNE